MFFGICDRSQKNIFLGPNLVDVPYKNIEDRIAASKRYYQANREKLLRQARDYYNATKPPRKEPGRSVTDPVGYQRDWTKANPEKSKKHARRYYLKSYGLTEEQYGTILKDQGGICALCSKDDPTAMGRKLNIDHDHKTGKVRGLLCHAHNTGLGKLGDTIAGLERALNYLRRNLDPQEPLPT